MTRKDYVLIADAIKRTRDNHDVNCEQARASLYAIADAAEAIAYALRRDNSRFEKARFMAACGFPASA